MAVEGFSWSDPETVTANSEGRLTSAQRAEIAGPEVPAPLAGSMVLVVTLVVAVALGAYDVGWIWIGIWAVVGLSISTGSWRIRDRVRRRRRIARLAAPRIGTGEGLVIIDRDRWCAATAAGTAITLPDNAPHPPPGRYLMYWLDSDSDAPGRLLSIEPLGRDTPTHPKGFPGTEAARIRASLLTAARCDDRDLVANRAGWLSRRQRKRLAREARADTTRWGLVLLAASVILGGPLVLMGAGLSTAMAEGDADAVADALCGVVVVGLPATVVPFVAAKLVATWRHWWKVRWTAQPVECTVTEVEMIDRNRVRLLESGRYLAASVEEVCVFLLRPGLYTVYYSRRPDGALRIESAEPVVATPPPAADHAATSPARPDVPGADEATAPKANATE